MAFSIISRRIFQKPQNNTSFSIETISLFNVADAVVLVTFNEDPFTGFNGIRIVGQARLLKTSLKNNNRIPVIFLTPNASPKTLEHEKIHICQYLRDSQYPLTNDQQKLFHSRNFNDCIEYLITSSKKNEVLDLIINAVCFNLWTEIEANYFTESDLPLYEVINKAYLSSQSISKFMALSDIKDFFLDSNDMTMIREGFSDFCNQIEMEVKWLREFFKTENFHNSLHDLILEIHDEIQTELMFGPIDDEDYEDIHISDLYDELDDGDH